MNKQKKRIMTLRTIYEGIIYDEAHPEDEIRPVFM